MPKNKKGQTKPGAAKSEVTVFCFSPGIILTGFVLHTSIQQKGPVNCDPVYATSSGAVAIKVHAKPGASESRVTDIGTDGVGIQIAAPPVDGEANTELVRFLAKLLNLRKSDVSLDKGSRSKDKVVMISATVTTSEILALLTQSIGR